jgi:RNA polymerase sigma factor (sigma-70 family)
LPESTDRLTEADRHLLAQVAAGDNIGWQTLVSRFQQRLIAFSCSKLGLAERTSIAEDLVQETFIGFLKSVSTFRGDCSLESYLFRILRFRLNDHYRSLGKQTTVSGCEIATDLISADDLTVSQNAVQQERTIELETALGNSIFQLTDDLKRRKKFRDLKVAEGLFFAGLRNQQIAALIDTTENEVAVAKHRLVKRLQDSLENSDPADIESKLFPSLRRTWENQRPSCPKRSTLGKYTLEILPPEWNDFVQFHVESLGCDYCRANLAELSLNQETAASKDISSQLFQSTIGFFNAVRS